MLIYIGRGAFLPHIPARNLTPAEVELAGGEAFLLSTGLYQKPAEPEKVKPGLKAKGPEIDE